MSQSRLGSFYEACINIAVGYGVSFCANWLILPAFGFDVTLAQNAAIGGLFTIVSIARSYLIRRYFNARIERAAARLAGEAT